MPVQAAPEPTLHVSRELDHAALTRRYDAARAAHSEVFLRLQELRTECAESRAQLATFCAESRAQLAQVRAESRAHLARVRGESPATHGGEPRGARSLAQQLTGLSAARIDDRTLLVTQPSGRRDVLTPTEWRLLRLLSEGDGAVMSRTELALRLWGLGGERRTEVEVYVSRLRRKLGGSRESLIETVRGEGYRLRSSPAA